MRTKVKCEVCKRMISKHAIVEICGKKACKPCHYNQSPIKWNKKD